MRGRSTGGDSGEAGEYDGEPNRSRFWNSGGAGRPGDGDAGDPLGCPRGARAVSCPPRSGRRAAAAGGGRRPSAGFPLPRINPRSQHAVCKIGRYRPNPHRAVAESRDRAVSRAGAKHRMTIRRRGFLLVLSSPSGAGKTTIARSLAERDPDLQLSVSVTTRPRREGEVEGR